MYDYIMISAATGAGHWEVINKYIRTLSKHINDMLTNQNSELGISLNKIHNYIELYIYCNTILLAYLVSRLGHIHVLHQGD